MTNALKGLMILLSVLTGFATVQAQSLSVGLRGGINSSNYHFEDEDDFDFDPESRLGLDFGLIFNIGLSENFSVQPELHYLQKGYQTEGEFLGIDIKTEAIINYVEIPLLAKVALGNETVQVLINAGPSLGYALNGKSKAEIGDEKEEEDIDFSEEEDFNRTELSLLFGAGIGFNTGPATIFVDARYLLGLTNLNDSEDEDATAVRNRGLGLGLGVLVPIGE